MKKILLILLILATTQNIAKADEIHHNINIDKIYNNGDWSSKKYIKQVIDDYTLFLHIKEEFSNCPVELPDNLTCYDVITNKILKNFYTNFDTNVQNYATFKEITEKVYAIPACHNKLSSIGGAMCNIDTMLYKANVIKTYTQTLLNNIDDMFSKYHHFLHNYKP